MTAAPSDVLFAFARELIVEGTEHLGETFAAACDSGGQFCLKASRYRGSSEHRRRLAAYAKTVLAIRIPAGTVVAAPVPAPAPQGGAIVVAGGDQSAGLPPMAVPIPLAAPASLQVGAWKARMKDAWNFSTDSLPRFIVMQCCTWRAAALFILLVLISPLVFKALARGCIRLAWWSAFQVVTAGCEQVMSEVGNMGTMAWETAKCLEQWHARWQLFAVVWAATAITVGITVPGDRWETITNNRAQNCLVSASWV